MKLGLFLRLALLLFLARVAASVADTQRCFYDKDQLAPDYIIPCYTGWGNAHFSCCKVGNKCLEHNACYDSDTGNTYQYGCTDETYQDPSCPQKCDLDRTNTNWVGLVYCNGKDNTPNNTWLCNHPDNCAKGADCGDRWPADLKRLPDAPCEDLIQECKAFDAPSTLSDLIALPLSTGVGGYFSDHPLTTAAVISSRQSMVTSQSSPSNPTSHEAGPTQLTPIQSTAFSPPSGSSKVAIAVGCSIGIPTMLAIAAFLYFYFRTRPIQSTVMNDLQSVSGTTCTSGEQRYSKAEPSGQSRPVSEMPGSPDFSGVQERTPLQSQSPLVWPSSGQSNLSGKRQENRRSEIHEFPG